VIELKDISRTFTVGCRPVHALRDINISISAGQYVSIMGPSGSGKSTLLNLVGCLDRPSGGSYVLDDREISQLSDNELSLVRRHKIGFVFQFFHLVPRLTAAQNVELPLMFAGIEPAVRAERTRRTLEAMGLSERMDHRPHQLSGGESQRVAIARAVVTKPDILLADEPTGNLDSAAGREIVDLLEGMNADGLTLVVVTHDPEMGRRATRRLKLADGILVQDERDSGGSS